MGQLGASPIGPSYAEVSGSRWMTVWGPLSCDNIFFDTLICASYCKHRLSENLNYRSRSSRVTINKQAPEDPNIGKSRMANRNMKYIRTVPFTELTICRCIESIWRQQDMPPYMLFHRKTCSPIGRRQLLHELWHTKNTDRPGLMR